MPTKPTPSDLVKELEAASTGTPPDVIVVRGYPGDPAVTPWRIYLSARLDVWIEIDDVKQSFVRSFPEVHPNRQEAQTVWLRRREVKTGIRIRYRIGSVQEVDEEQFFLSGRFVEDFMSRSESEQVVWDEQQYGPVTTAASFRRCF
jgi:hypothetical protein